MAKLLCAFVVVALMALSAEALMCYECPLGCNGDDMSKWPTQDCGNTPNLKKVCLTQVLIPFPTPRESSGNVPSMPEYKPKYECVDSPGEKTVRCDTCEKDLCNSAGFSSIDNWQHGIRNNSSEAIVLVIENMYLKEKVNDKDIVIKSLKDQIQTLKQCIDGLQSGKTSKKGDLDLQ